MGFDQRVIKELFGSASRCAFPACDEKLVIEDRGVLMVNVDIAHIRSSSKRGPRHDADYPVEKLDQTENLLLLCRKHHRLVDRTPRGAPPAYSATELEDWKRAQVAEGIGGALPDERVEEVIRFYEDFASRITADPEFGRWRTRTPKSGPGPRRGSAAGFANVADDPVSVSAAWSVAQLIDGFAPRAAIFPEPASAFGSTVAAFLLDDESGFTARLDQLEQRCSAHLFAWEAMLASIAFSVTAVRLWESAARRHPGLLRDSWLAAGLTIPYVATW